jgi:squalene-hopene/tetraprenyl-beta-curcumene cyclase
MAAYDEDVLTAADGKRHVWREEFARKMLSLQGDDGAWVNPDSPRWMEGNKDLTTARVVIALNLATR